jgi:hypothetical protein
MKKPKNHATCSMAFLPPIPTPHVTPLDAVSNQMNELLNFCKEKKDFNSKVAKGSFLALSLHRVIHTSINLSLVPF